MTSTIRSTGPALLGLLLMSGCFEDRVAGSTSVGNPPQGVVEYSMEATSGVVAVAKASAARDTAIQVTDSNGTVFRIETSLVHVGQVQIKLPDGVKCSEAIKPQCELDKAKLTTPFIADLMAGTLHPDIGSFLLPVGNYYRVEVKLEEFKAKPLPPGIDSSIAGHTLLIKGTFAYNGKSDRRFSIVLDFGDVVAYEADTSLQILEKGLNRLLLSLDARKWLGKAAISDCLEKGAMALDPQGDLVIDKGNMCSGLEQVLKDGFKSSGSLKRKPE